MFQDHNSKKKNNEMCTWLAKNPKWLPFDLFSPNFKQIPFQIYACWNVKQVFTSIDKEVKIIIQEGFLIKLEATFLWKMTSSPPWKTMQNTIFSWTKNVIKITTPFFKNPSCIFVVYDILHILVKFRCCIYYTFWMGFFLPWKKHVLRKSKK